MEERNLLRRREWERRSQEAQQQQEQYQENAPLFGEPFKVSGVDLPPRSSVSGTHCGWLTAASPGDWGVLMRLLVGTLMGFSVGTF